MRILWAFIKKEFLQIFRDPSSILIAFILPTLLSLIYMYGINVDSVNINLGLKLDDANPRVVSLARSFSNNQYIRTKVYDDKDAMYSDIVNSKLQGAVIVPNDFTVTLNNGRTAQILVITDGSETNTANYVQSYAKELSGSEPRLEIVTRNWFNVNLDYKYYSLVSLMAMLSMVIVLLLTSLSIAREKEVGTFDQLIVSPLSSTEILIGKAVPAQLLAWLLTMVMLAISVHFFDFPLVGSLAVFLAADFVALLALVGVGLFISSLCRTQQQAILGVFTFQMPAVLLSGFISPIDNMPVILQYLTYLNPLRFFLVIAKGVLLKNMDMYHVLINLIPLALIAVLTLSIASWTFKSKLE